MKLSLINNETLTDEMIDKIVYSDTDDNLKNTNYGIVFESKNVLILLMMLIEVAE